MCTTYVCIYCLELYTHNLAFSSYPTLVLGIPGISDAILSFSISILRVLLVTTPVITYVCLHQKADLDGVVNHMKNLLDTFTCRPIQKLGWATEYIKSMVEQNCMATVQSSYPWKH